MMDSESKTDQQNTDALAPSVHGSASMMLATFIGGPFAAAYLLRSNFCRLHSQKNALRHLLIFGFLGIVNLYLAVTTPSDVISQFIGAVLPSLLLVGMYLFYLNHSVLMAHQRRNRSVWYGAAIGFITRLAINGGVAIVMRLREVWDVGYTTWLQKNA